MRYFRHAPLAYWALVCTALAALLGAALVMGRDATPLPSRDQDGTEASVNVHAMRMRLAGLHRVAAPPATALPEWSRETATFADALAKERVLTDGEDDDLAVVYRALAADARRLAAADPADGAEVRAGVLLVLADGDALTAVLAGAEPSMVRPLPGEVLEDELGEPALPGTPETPQLPAAPVLPDAPQEDPAEVPDLHVTPIDPTDLLETTPGGTSR